jgi:hypothetical protein
MEQAKTDTQSFALSPQPYNEKPWASLDIVDLINFLLKKYIC